MKDGLNLIYALENCNSGPIGKYNKRVMMDVQRSDNVDVSLKFLAAKGVNTSVISAKGFFAS